MIPSPSIDADCYHQFLGPITRNLRIFPNFTQHPTIKESSTVVNLAIYFGASTIILTGLGVAFPNLRRLYINDHALTLIFRSDLVNMTRLIKLEITWKSLTSAWNSLPKMLYGIYRI